MAEKTDEIDLSQSMQAVKADSAQKFQTQRIAEAMALWNSFHDQHGSFADEHMVL